MVAVVPEPPLLVPELATGAVAETAALRAACRAVARRLAAAATSWVAVGADAGGRRTVTADARGSFVGFGADAGAAVVVGLSPHAGGPVDPALPLPLLIAGWLREGLPVIVRGELIAPDAEAAACLALGAELAREAAASTVTSAAPSDEGGGQAAGPGVSAAERAVAGAGSAEKAASAGEDIGLLVIGDGAAMHTEKAPGHLDERAGPFDDAVAAALAAADPTALAALDRAQAADLWASGRAPWQVLAGATRDGAWKGELLHSSRPFGVGYHVAVWQRCG
jgi:hypothetical protein